MTVATVSAFSRRALLLGASAAAFAPLTAFASPAPSGRIEPVKPSEVRLKPSIFADAERANHAYLLDLSPDRLLHNFHKYAGLEPRGEVYGGWEAMQIAGHTLGHYLTACALTVAHTQDDEIRDRLTYAVSEMARIQQVRGDGYLGGADAIRNRETVDGKVVFEELRRGEIRTTLSKLNETWVPLYTYHKLHAGLLDAHRLVGVPGALEGAVGMAEYFAGIVESLSEEQVQRILECEFGGLNESYAETYAQTGDPRWLEIARKLRHKRILDPLAAGVDNLEGLHANTQIPKVLGLARIHELTGDPVEAATARFFHDTVARHHSYVIGGNSNREHFTGPNQISGHIAETTCEACNTYNMLKLTRHLYAWDGNAAHFDYFERAHLNHIMAHQRPDTGQFVYFMPLSAGGRRSYSTPDNSFWCCVGSGIESHSKHAESIFWRRDDRLFVNLFIPSQLNLQNTGLALDLDTRFPEDGLVTLTVVRAPSTAFELALRIPSWTRSPVLEVNGRPAAIEMEDGYAVLRRRWRAGDRIVLNLPMHVTAEATPDDPTLLAFLSGPLVLAADMGPAARPFEAPGLAVVTAQEPTELLLNDDGPHRYRLPTTHSGDVKFSPFFNQYDRRTAVYVPTFTPARWGLEGPAFMTAERERVDVEKRTIDILYLGEQQPEQDHDVQSERSETIQKNGRGARRIFTSGHATMTMRVEAGPQVLRITYWGQDIDRPLDISLDGRPVAREMRQARSELAFVSVDYPIPAAARPGTAILRLDAPGKDAIVYEVRIIRAA